MRQSTEAFDWEISDRLFSALDWLKFFAKICPSRILADGQSAAPLKRAQATSSSARKQGNQALKSRLYCSIPPLERGGP